MAWARIDDNFFNHPKVRKAGKDAIIFHVAALCHSNAFTTDGFIANDMLELIAAQAFQRKANGLADRLVECGLWDRIEGGYLIHDFLEYNYSKQQVSEIKSKRADAGRQGGKQTQSKVSSKIQANDKQNVKQTSSHTHTHINPILNKEIVDSSSSSFEDIYRTLTGIEPKRTEEEKALIQRFTKLGVLPTEYQKAIQEMQEKGYKIASMLSAETWTMNNRNGKKARKVETGADLEKFKQAYRKQQLEA